MLRLFYAGVVLNHFKRKEEEIGIVSVSKRLEISLIPIVNIDTVLQQYVAQLTWYQVKAKR